MPRNKLLEELIQAYYAEFMIIVTTRLASVGLDDCTYEYYREDVESPWPALSPTASPALAGSSVEISQPSLRGGIGQSGSSEATGQSGSNTETGRSGSSMWTTFVSRVLHLCSLSVAL